MAVDSVIASALSSPFGVNTRGNLREQRFDVVPQEAPVEVYIPNRRRTGNNGFLHRGGAIAVAHRARNMPRR